MGPFCSIDGCGRKRHGRDLCGMHDQRRRRHGDPLRGSAKKTPDGSLLAFLEDHKKYDGADCLIWPFAKAPSGHGILRFRGIKMSAGRAMCLVAHGEPPTPEHESAHTCGRGHFACVHPEHVRWATAQENQLDRRIHGTDMRGSKHHAAVLTEEIVLGLRRRMLGKSRQYAQVGEEFGVSGSAIRCAVLGISWAHI